MDLICIRLSKIPINRFLIYLSVFRVMVVFYLFVVLCYSLKVFALLSTDNSYLYCSLFSFHQFIQSWMYFFLLDFPMQFTKYPLAVFSYSFLSNRIWAAWPIMCNDSLWTLSNTVSTFLVDGGTSCGISCNISEEVFAVNFMIHSLLRLNYSLYREIHSNMKHWWLNMVMEKS